MRSPASHRRAAQRCGVDLLAGPDTGEVAGREETNVRLPQCALDALVTIDYQAHIDPEDDQPYLDLATLYRNLVKERALGRDTGTLHVMMKGGDWTFGCQLVDGALGALGTPPSQMPARIFTPQVLAPTGAKLSKSLLREQGKGVLPADVEPWMLDTTAWPGDVDDYVDALVWLVGELLTDPKHFFRSFTVKELGRLMTARPTEPARPRPRDGHLQALLRPHRHQAARPPRSGSTTPAARRSRKAR